MSHVTPPNEYLAINLADVLQPPDLVVVGSCWRKPGEDCVWKIANVDHAHGVVTIETPVQKLPSRLCGIAFLLNQYVPLWEIIPPVEEEPVDLGTALRLGEEVFG